MLRSDGRRIPGLILRVEVVDGTTQSRFTSVLCVRGVAYWSCLCPEVWNCASRLWLSGLARYLAKSSLPERMLLLLRAGAMAGLPIYLIPLCGKRLVVRLFRFVHDNRAALV